MRDMRERGAAIFENAHRIKNRWTLRATGLFTDVDRVDIYSYVGNAAVTTAANAVTPAAANNGTTTQIAYRGDSFSKTTSFDFNGVGSFRLFGQEHTLILGADYQAQDYDSSYMRLNGHARINAFNPVSPLEPPLNPHAATPVTPYAGIVWDVTTNLNMYGTYADSFAPQAAPANRVCDDGGTVEPLIGSSTRSAPSWR